MRVRFAGALVSVAIALATTACGKGGGDDARAVQVNDTRLSCTKVDQPDRADPTDGMVRIKGGKFIMGDLPERSEEGPPQEVSVDDFWIDRTEVTNAQFAAFVADTGYVTLAERPLDPKLYPGVPKELLAPSSLVFTMPEGHVDLRDPSHWWKIVPGADWKHPSGPGSSIEGMDDFPVVQIAQQDAAAYAKWAGRDLPSEAEWEFAARSGVYGSRFTWGDEAPKADSANTWQGVFPSVDEGTDGYKARVAPVGCFKPNASGLFDMAGNVWEWTKTWYRPGLEVVDGKPVEPREDQAIDPDEPGARKHVAKGGSFLCADNYCLRYRPSARTPGPPDTGSSHIGFRTVYREPT